MLSIKCCLEFCSFWVMKVAYYMLSLFDTEPNSCHRILSIRPENIRKTGSQIFPEGVERDRWHKMGQ